MPPRTSSNLTRGKIWLPKTRRVIYSILISGTDVTEDVINAEFVRGVVGVETPCRIELIDPNGTYAGLYNGGEVVQFKCDLSAGTTIYWEGKLERPVKKYGSTYTLELIGSHYQSDLLDITVTEEYTGVTTASAILITLISTYLSGFTSVNVTTSTVTPTIRWNNKPFYDCVLDLCDAAGFDCYVDNNKDFHFFAKESIENQTEAIVWNDTLIGISDFGADNLDIRNRIIVYGEDEKGLPIVYRTDDTASQTTYGVKEKIVKDTSIRTYARAQEYGNTILNDEKEKSQKGEFNCLLLSGINPGDMIWIAQPVQGIEDTFRMVKYTTKIPNLTTDVVISKEKTIPQIFKERKSAELASENIINPYGMTNSLNFVFNDSSEYDSSLSSSVTTVNGYLKTNGSASGIMISNLRTETANITAMHIKIVGDSLSNINYFISTDNGVTWESVELETQKTLLNPGINLRLKIELNSVNTLIDSIVVMYR